MDEKYSVIFENLRKRIGQYIDFFEWSLEWNKLDHNQEPRFTKPVSKQHCWDATE